MSLEFQSSSRNTLTLGLGRPTRRLQPTSLTWLVSIHGVFLIAHPPPIFNKKNVVRRRGAFFSYWYWKSVGAVATLYKPINIFKPWLISIWAKKMFNSFSGMLLATRGPHGHVIKSDMTFTKNFLVNVRLSFRTFSSLLLDMRCLMYNCNDPLPTTPGFWDRGSGQLKSHCHLHKSLGLSCSNHFPVVSRLHWKILKL